MKKTLLFGLLIVVLVVLPLLGACAKPAPTPTPTPTPKPTPTPTPTAPANWWDKFGEPQYGGKITIAEAMVGTNWDVLTFGGGGWFYEALFYPDWTLDRNIWPFKGVFVPDQYWKGNLAESWEIPDPQTIIVHIRKGILWQDKPPVNGREFTAYDVQKHYDRTMKESPQFAGMLIDWEKVTATDNYTAVFKFKKPSGQWLQSVTDVASPIEAPEWAALPESARNKWENTVGTGPWMLTGFVQGSSYTYSRNPNYWGHDERHPENRLPYADNVVSLVILDSSTRIAALRTGKVDYLGVSMTFVSWQQAAALAETNPELMQAKIPQGTSGMTFRLDKEPFTDINVRKAMQMAINRQEIAQTFYGGVGEGVPSGLVTRAYKGYAFPYEDWPQELKDEYAYNPEKAKQLLAEAGYPNGFQTNIITSTTGDTQLLQVFQSYLKDIGVDLEIRPMDWGAYETFRRAGKHDQMVTAGGAFNWPPVRFVEQYYSKGPDRGDTMIDDPGYDALRNQFFASTDPAETQRILQELDRYVIEHHWLVSAGESYSFAVWQPYLKGYSGELPFKNVNLDLARLWIDQDLKKSMAR